MKNDVMFGFDFKRWHRLGSLYAKLIPLEIQQYSNILTIDKKRLILQKICQMYLN